jgi:hypothetical protein
MLQSKRLGLFSSVLVIAGLYRFASASQLDPEAYVDASTLWQPPYVSVCWELTDGLFTRERGWVEQSVRDHIGRVSSLRFLPASGWGECRSDALGIRIRVADAWPRSFVGRQWARDAQGNIMKDSFGRPQERPTTMILNFSFQTVKEDFDRCFEEREHCIRAIAVHEFLHAVGFLHEQLRPDAPSNCKMKFAHIRDFEGYKPLKVGEYDPDSHMNYCTDMYRHPIRLSSGDLGVLRRFYDQQ